MSFHNKPNYQIPELIEALKAHRLPHDTPSQLADSFRIGWMACRELDRADSVPKAQFDDPKVQAVYTILCEDAEPPKGEHWEGFAARRIVDALLADSVQEDAQVGCFGPTPYRPKQPN